MSLKLFGQGLQYKVYDLGDRVKKVPTSAKEIKRTLLKWYPAKYILHPIELKKKIAKTIKERKTNIEQIKKLKIKKEVFGNPLFKGLIIEQDKAIRLKDEINKSKDYKKFIDQSVDIILECWKLGFSEVVYNITVNNGINKKNKVILLDFGEVTFDKNKVKEDILNKRWEKAWSFKKDLSKKVKSHYKKQMGKKITLKNLNKYWRSKV